MSRTAASFAGEGPPEPHPWRRAAAWLAFLGPFFFASYGFANWLAARRAHVGSIAFPWERSIPFMPWTIVPYWSIDLLYAISFFVCTTRREVDRHAQRLLFIQIVSVAFFIAFPLRFSFDRPSAGGLFGSLFTALMSFDKPFNQAPSLHIALLVAIWARLAGHIASTAGRWILHGWMVLIGLSILTTYQHHFFDLPTGLALGFLAMWLLPDAGESPLRSMTLTADRKRRVLSVLYGAGAAIAAAVATLGGAWLWLFWLAIALALVALNYLAIGARGFQKTADGRLTLGARGLFAPYLLLARLNSRFWTRNVLGANEVAGGVFIGRIPNARDLAPFAAVVDLCAELSIAECRERSYRSIALLDLTVPDHASLRDAAAAIEAARERGPVLVCCALGYSRSAAAVVAWLLTTHRAASLDEAMAMVRKARPAMVLRAGHRAALEALA